MNTAMSTNAQRKRKSTPKQSRKGRKDHARIRQAQQRPHRNKYKAQ
jgi:hypothetical protein